MKWLSTIGLCAGLILATGCARVYQTADASTTVQQHQRVAILPAAVTLTNRVKLKGGKTTAELEQETGEELQRALFTWMLERQMEGEFLVLKLQDPASTNAKLRQLGYFDNKDLSNEWLAKTLEVDALITADFRLDRLLNTQAARAINILTDDVALPDRQGAVWLKLYDRQNDHLIWTYNRQLQRSYSQRPESIINGVMRHASKKMPYRQPSGTPTN